MPGYRGVRNAAENGEDGGVGDEGGWLLASPSSMPFHDDIISFRTVVKLLKMRLM
jgi:hypothetical protein